MLYARVRPGAVSESSTDIKSDNLQGRVLNTHWVINTGEQRRKFVRLRPTEYMR